MMYRIYPVEKNHITVRFDNLGDRFDNNWGTFNVDVRRFASEIYREANKGKLPQNIDVKEMSLSANQEITRVRKNKPKWNAKSDYQRLT